MIPLLKDKSYSFAVEIVRLVQYLQQEKKEYVPVSYTHLTLPTKLEV